ncbi:hypothetical protein PVAP13_4KG304600 [Panicum virgatum]|uniref:Uncharacterized protein n=1 Tax=Panicum virgatum TaxID=38727 RepID=A0A8T0TLC7_PANVG|nr:hypothetical protein PVAP13_4KG304600 [Panicum virgatum]
MDQRQLLVRRGGHPPLRELPAVLVVALVLFRRGGHPDPLRKLPVLLVHVHHHRRRDALRPVGGGGGGREALRQQVRFVLAVWLRLRLLPLGAELGRARRSIRCRHGSCKVPAGHGCNLIGGDLDRQI